MRTLIVGAGIAGSALTRVLRDRGAAATLIADPARPPHSLAAAAVLRAAYHARNPGETAAFRRSLELYTGWGVGFARGATVTSYRHDAPLADADWYLMDPAAALVAPDAAAAVTPHPDGVLTAAGEVIPGETVVWCAGAYGAATGAYTTHGDTWIHPDPAAVAATAEAPLRIHHWAPYRTLVAGAIAGQARLGSSSAVRPATAAAQGERMLATAARLGIIRGTDGWQRISGTRLRTAAACEQLDGRNWRFSGLHRTGYALAPAHAESLAWMVAG